MEKTDIILTEGTVINNGAIVMACTKYTDRVVGETLASWTALCHKNDSDLHPWVVWNVVARPEGFEAYNGSYAKTLDEAQGYYEARRIK
jgi:tetrahydrodipicolinate N-succinyltransferase